MKTLKTFLTAIMLCLSLSVMGQEVNLLLEDHLENMAESDESADWDEVIEELTQKFQQPLNINLATREQLEQFPFLSDIQIENILAYIYTHGQMQTIYELQLVDEMDRRTIQLMLPFVYVEAQPAEKQYPKLKNIARYGRHELLTRFDIPFYRRKGYEQNFLGTPQYHSVRYAFSYSDYLQAGFTAEKDAGEPLFRLHNKQGYDHYGFYLTLRNLWKIKTLAIGNYRMAFGHGLVLGSGFILGKSYSLTTAETRASGIRKHASTDEYNYFQGVAATIKVTEHLEASAFYSNRKLDGIVKDGVITSITTTGYHRTQTEADRRGALRMQSAGGNVSWRQNRFNVGLTGIWYGFDKHFMPRLSGYAQYNLHGKDFYNIGLDYQVRLRRLNLAGEVAKSKEGWAIMNRLIYQPALNYKLMLVHRYYRHDYWAFFARAFSDGGKVQNENGWYLAAEAAPFSHFRFFGSVDLVSYPWWKYRISKPSKGFEGRLRVEYQPSSSLSMFVNYRYKRKERDVSGTKGDLILPTHQHQVRYRLSYQTDKVLLRTTADFNTFYQLANSYGWQVTQLAGWKLWKLALNVQGTYFHTDDYDSRVSGYEKGLLYTFYSPSFSGHGFRYSSHLRLDLGKAFMFIAKFSHTHYLDRPSIGSGNEQINGPDKCDLQLQVRVKM